MSGEVPVDRPWISHYPDYVPKRLEVPAIGLPQLLDASVRRWPGRTAIDHYGYRLTYAELGAEVDRFAGTLARDGIGPGKRIALLLPNHPVYPIAFFGALRQRAAVVPISPLYQGDDLRTALEMTRPDALVTLDFLYPNLARAGPARAPGRVYVARMRSFYPWHLRPFVNLVLRRRGLHPDPPSGPGVVAWAEARRLPPGPLAPPSADPGNEPAVLQGTGGTTGTPKLAVLTHRNLVANAHQCRAWFAIQPPGTSVVLAAIPFFHVYGMTVAMNYPFLVGATIVLETRPEADEMLKLIDRHRPSEFPGVPALYAALNRHPRLARHDLRSIKVCVSGSAPLPREVAEQFEARSGGYLIEGYGLTEASPVTHANPIGGDRRAGSIGLPFPETDQRIVDANDPSRVLPPGEVGELAVRGPQVMAGYLDRPEETALVLRDGWLLTGDLARVDADGYAYVVDRKKDLIVVGGLKVVPREVEEELYRHPAVAEAAVAGVPDPVLGERVEAFVVAKAGAAPTEAELIEFVRGRIAHYKAPRRVHFRTALPRTAALKVLRRTLRAEAEADPRPVAGGGDPAPGPPAGAR